MASAAGALAQLNWARVTSRPVPVPVPEPVHSMNATFVVVVSSYVRPSVVPVTAPEHTIVAATPIAVSLLTPPQSVAVSVVGATEACVVQQMWFPFVSPLIVYVAPASSGLVPCAIAALAVPESAAMATSVVNARIVVLYNSEPPSSAPAFSSSATHGAPVGEGGGTEGPRLTEYARVALEGNKIKN